MEKIKVKRIVKVSKKGRVKENLKLTDIMEKTQQKW